MTAFPSSVAARKCLQGEGCSETVYWVLRRTLLINSGLRLAGERKNTLKKSLYASLAVQAYVFAWTASHMDEPVASLPSGETAHALPLSEPDYGLVENERIWSGTRSPGQR